MRWRQHTALYDGRDLNNGATPTQLVSLSLSRRPCGGSFLFCLVLKMARAKSRSLSHHLGVYSSLSLFLSALSSSAYGRDEHTRKDVPYHLCKGRGGRGSRVKVSFCCPVVCRWKEKEEAPIFKNSNRQFATLSNLLFSTVNPKSRKNNGPWDPLLELVATP